MWTRTNGKAAALALATLLAAACIAYLVLRFEWTAAFRLVRRADLATLAITALCLHFAYICVRTLRWQVVMRDRHPDVTFGGLYWITAVVVSLAILTHGQIGETVKVELSKRRGLPGRLAGLGSFALERVLDLMTVAAFGLIGLAFGSGLSDRYPALPWLAAVLLAIGLAALSLLRRSRRAAETGWIALFRSGTGTAAIKMKMLALTVASWGIVALGWQISLHRVGFDASLPAVCWLVSLVTFGTLISLIPGGVGVAEVLTIQALITMGAAPATAQAGALILRVYALIGIAFGFCHLMVWPFLRNASRGREA
jgi:uncharacterized membrane protein YbhN (UPF0104 family)